MNHKWKLILGVGLFFLLLLGAAQFVRLPLFGVQPEEAIHHQAALVLSFNKNNLTASRGWQSVFLPQALQEDLEKFEQAFAETIKIEDGHRIMASVHPTRTSGTDVLFVLSGFRRLRLDDALAKSGWRVRKSLFKNRRVFTVKSRNQTFALAKYRNLLLLSTHAYLVENALSQLRSPATNLCEDVNFKKMDQRVRSAPDDLHVLLNLQNFSAEFSPVIEASKLEQVAQLSKAGTWLHLQFPKEGKDAPWEGELSVASGNALLKANGRSQRLPYKNAFQTIPANVSALVWLAIDGYKPVAEKKIWDSYFKPWAGYEWAFATGEPADAGAFEQFYLLKTTDDKKAGASLQKLAAATGSATGYDYQMFKIWTVEGPAIARMMGLPGASIRHYLTLLGGYVLAANTRAGMERWLDNYLVGGTFSKQASFLQSLNTLPDKAQGFLYLESGKSWQQIAPFLDDKIITSLSGNPLQFGHLAAVMNRRGNFCRFAAVSPSPGVVREDQPATVLWRAPLAARAAMPPFVFKNEAGQEWLVFVQDESNQLYLISRGGRVLWRRQLDERILSDVTRIDLHNNGESQLVFSTTTKIFTINMAGEDVEGYPLNLQVPATNGVAVVDFFKSHDYRFFIACKNEKAYGFDEKGSPVEGWRPHDSIGVVRQPIRHFQAQGMDFLVLLNEAGTLQVFQKNGNYRFAEKNFGAEFRQPPAYQASRSSARIVACDVSGRVFVTNLSGESFKLALKAGNNTGVRFAFADIGGDERKDYLALSGRYLAVYFYEGNRFKQMFTHRFEYPQDDVFAVGWQRNQKAFTGTVNATKDQIFMLDGSGSVLPQFPLAGTTAFSIVDLLNDGKPVLVTGFSDSVIAYALE
jgi:uncharacterized protein DUF3352